MINRLVVRFIAVGWLVSIGMFAAMLIDGATDLWVYIVGLIFNIAITVAVFVFTREKRYPSTIRARRNK
jgi:uncharacterized membrane protein